jgi:hypothetical protein
VIQFDQFVIAWACAALAILAVVTYAALRAAARLEPLPRPTSRRDLRSQRSAARAAAGRHATHTVAAGRRAPAPRLPTTYAVTLPAELLRAELDHVLGCTIRCTTTRQEATMPELADAPMRRIRAAITDAQDGDARHRGRHVHTEWEVLCLEDPPMAFLFEGESAERDAFDLFESEHVRTSSAPWKIRTRTVYTYVQHSQWHDAGGIGGHDIEADRADSLDAHANAARAVALGIEHPDL